MKRIIFLTFICLTNFIFMGCIPMMFNQEVPSEPNTAISISNQNVKVNSEITINMRVYSNFVDGAWYFILRNVPNNIEVINEEKSERFSKNGLCLVHADNEGFASAKFSYVQTGTYNFSVNICYSKDLKNITEISEDFGILPQDYFYTINVSDN